MGVAVQSPSAEPKKTDSSAPLEASRNEILWFSLGQAGMGIPNAAKDFLVFFYTQIVGLSGTLTGLAAALVSVTDAISDPLAGALSDRLQSKHGRRHPFLYLSAPFFAFAFCLLWMPPKGFGAVGLFLWLFCSKAAVELAATFYAVPYYALGAELSSNYQQRTRIVMARQFSERISRIAVGLLLIFWFFRKTEAYPKNGQENPDAYPAFAIVFALAMPVVLIACAWGTRHLIPRLPKAHPDANSQPILKGTFRDFREALRYRCFRVLFAAAVSASIGWGVSGMLVVHLITYFWEIGTDGLFYWGVGMYAGTLTGMPFWTSYSRKIDKRNSYIIGTIGYVIFSTVPVLMKLSGWWVSPESILYLPLYIGTTAYAAHFCSASRSVTEASMLADVADLDELHHGKRREGIFFGVESFAGKAVHGMGTLVAGLIIDIAGIAGNTNPDAETKATLGLAYSLSLIVLMTVSMYFASKYDIDKDRHAEIRAELDWRKSRL